MSNIQSGNILLFANSDWYLFNFRRSFAQSLIKSGYQVHLVSPPGVYGEKLLTMGFNWTAAPMQRQSLNPLNELVLVNWLRRFIIEKEITLVHGFTIKSVIYGGLAARLAGVSARVHAVAGMGYVFISSDLKAKLLRPVVRALFRLALGGANSRLILQNPDDVLLFRNARLIDESRIRLIPGSGVDCVKFSSSERTVSKPFRVLLPARLLWDKGLAEFVEAARLLIQQGRPIEFLLAGKPDAGNPAAVDETILQGWVRERTMIWLGHVDDMPALFRSVDLVVLPSYREGLPKGLIEAGACGLPLITTDVPGCREVVRHEVDGLLVPVKDSVGLAAAIARLQDDPGLRRRLGAAARARVLAEFDEQIVIRKTLAVYQEVLSAVPTQV